MQRYGYFHFKQRWSYTKVLPVAAKSSRHHITNEYRKTLNGGKMKTDGLRTFGHEEQHGWRSPGFPHYFSYIINRVFQKPPTWSSNRHTLQEKPVCFRQRTGKSQPNSRKPFWSIFTLHQPNTNGKTTPQPHVSSAELKQRADFPPLTPGQQKEAAVLWYRH